MKQHANMRGWHSERIGFSPQESGTQTPGGEHGRTERLLQAGDEAVGRAWDENSETFLRRTAQGGGE